MSIDLNKKKEACRGNGVREYFVWRTEDAAIDWCYLNEGRFDARAADAHGILTSGIFTGLSLNVPALLSGDLAAVLQTLDRACAQEAHAMFVGSLKATQ